MMNNESKTRRKIRNDFILIAAVLLIAAILLSLFFVFRKDGTKAVVYVDKKIYGEYPLNKDAEIEITTDNGTNTLCISEGKASVTNASCPGIPPKSRCTNQHAVSKKGQSITCLPNKVVVSIE